MENFPLYMSYATIAVLIILWAVWVNMDKRRILQVLYTILFLCAIVYVFIKGVMGNL